MHYNSVHILKIGHKFLLKKEAIFISLHPYNLIL